jgi:hypothetical protein
VPNPGGTNVGTGGNTGSVTISAGTLNSGNIELGTGSGGTGNITVSGTGNLNTGYVNIGVTGGAGTITHTAGSISTTSWFTLGLNSGGQGVYSASGTAVLNAINQIEVGPRNGSDGEMNISGNAEVRANNLLMSHAGTSARSEVNLTGGDLVVNNIRMEQASSDFNWGAGTIRYRSINSGSQGGFAINGPGGEDPQRGSTLRVYQDGADESFASLTTGNGVNAASVLDLGSFYKNDITRFDVLTLDGALNLTSANDILRFGGGDNFLSPYGWDTRDWGTLTLVQAAEGITGQFSSFEFGGNVLRPFNNPFPGSAELLAVNTYALEYTGTEILFHYRAGGVVPEPSTVSMLFFGIAAIRIARMKIFWRRASSVEA